LKKARGLLGYMTENEAIALLSNGLAIPNQEELKKKWLASVEKTKQRTYATNLTPEILNITDKHQQKEINEILSRIQNRLKAEPQAFGNSWDLKLISINGLVTIQKTVGVDFATETVQDVKGKEDLVGALKVTLNNEIKKENFMISLDAADPNCYTITSKNLNFGFLNPSPTQIPIGNTQEKVWGIGFNFASRTSYVVVLHSNGRYILKDGYHKVYGLMSKGFTHVPCILMNGDAQQLIPQQAGLFPISTVLSENPPMLRDFTDIGDDIIIPEIVNVVKVNIQSTQVLF